MLRFSTCALAQAARADPTGTWTWYQPGYGRPAVVHMTLTLKVEGEKVTGGISAAFPTREVKAVITEATLNGDELSLRVAVGGNDIKTNDTKTFYHYTGKVMADAIKGEMRGGQMISPREWVAKRTAAKPANSAPAPERKSDPTGTWTWNTGKGGPLAGGAAGPLVYNLRLKVDGEKVTGTYFETLAGRLQRDRSFDLSDGKLKGDELSFIVVHDGAEFKYAGKVMADRIKGKEERRVDGNIVWTRDWAAQVQKTDPTGTWSEELQGGPGGGLYCENFELKVEGEKVTGTRYNTVGGGILKSSTHAIADGQFKSDQLSFTVARDGPIFKEVCRYSGMVAADGIKGTVERHVDGRLVETREWVTKRAVPK
jgi:hypothetical protein